jgi:predicted adenylyl cyclase CyaB
MPQKEVEVKVLEVDAHALQEKLSSSGAKKVFDGLMEVRTFEPLPEGVGLLRVRREGGECFLTVKRFLGKGEAKVTDESSVKVGDFDSACSLLEGLGFRTEKRYRKRRTSYVLHDIRFEFDTFLDELSFVPTFLEIEASSLEGVHKALSLLGIPQEKAFPWTGGDVIRHYQKNPLRLSSTTRKST